MYTGHIDRPGVYNENIFWDTEVGGQLNSITDEGEWHHYEVYIKLNTVYTEGNGNGILRGWYDGVLQFEREDFRFRTDGTVYIDYFEFSTWTNASTTDEYIWYDDFIISTHRSWSAFDVSPTNGGSGVSTTPTITWDHVDYIDDVDVWLDKAACSTVECDTGGVGTSDDDADKTWTPGTLDENSTYCLGVKINVGALTGDCQEFEFSTTTGPPPPPTGLSTCSYNSLGMTGVYDDQGATVGE